MRFSMKPVVAGAILPLRYAAITLACVVAITCFSTTGLAQQSKKSTKSRTSNKSTPAAIPVPPPIEIPAPPPPPPPTPEQMPPGVPQVSWDGEQLTINSDNSTLADILTAVRRLTGADIDIPPRASSERVAARLGPGPAREILGSLLGGTEFNYVIQASDANPSGIQSIFLTARNKDGALGSKSAIVAAMQRPDSRRTVEESSNLRASEKSEPSADASPTADKTSAESASNSEGRGASSPPASADSKPANEPQSTTLGPLPVQADLAPPPAPSEPDPNRPKTVEDKIQDMQSLFEQRRQMIEQSRKPQTTN